mmetsp:Transcript_69561/g.203571  ORF Transcript_69561/g.203571 Transcript_69561/m.203571 type:complete len:230 (-) Transcript_69561:46-735(-)
MPASVPITSESCPGLMEAATPSSSSGKPLNFIVGSAGRSEKRDRAASKMVASSRSAARISRAMVSGTSCLLPSTMRRKRGLVSPQAVLPVPGRLPPLLRRPRARSLSASPPGCAAAASSSSNSSSANTSCGGSACGIPVSVFTKTRQASKPGSRRTDQGPTRSTSSAPSATSRATAAVAPVSQTSLVRLILRGSRGVDRCQGDGSARGRRAAQGGKGSALCRAWALAWE